MSYKMDSTNEEKKRIWIFIAYQSDEYGSIPIFSKLFNDHTKLKEFSASHSSEFKGKTDGYHSTYLDLTDKSFINQELQSLIAEILGKKEKKIVHFFGEAFQEKEIVTVEDILHAARERGIDL